MGDGVDQCERKASPSLESMFEATFEAGTSRKSNPGGNALSALEAQREQAQVCKATDSPHDISEMLWNYRIGEASSEFDHVAHVCAPLGLRVRTEPHLGSAELGIISFDTRVHVQRRTNHGWAYVTVVPQEVGARSSALVGQSGFVESRFLLIDPPDQDSFLHLVRPGEGAASLVAKYYAPPDGFTSGYDAYLFVSALWVSNQHLHTATGPYPGGMKERPVSLSTWESLIRAEAQEDSLRNYLGAQLVAGNALWIPSIARVRALMRAEAITSATFMASFGEEGGFLRGLFDGIEDGLRDLVEQVEQLAKLIYDLMNDGLVETLIKLAEKLSAFISHFDMERAKAAGKRAALDFIAKWTDEDGYLRGHFQGKTIGYLVVLILPMILTEGMGELAAAPRAMAVLDELSSVADTSAVIGDLSSSLERAGVASKVAASGYLPAGGIATEPAAGELAEVEQDFEALFGKEEPVQDPPPLAPPPAPTVPVEPARALTPGNVEEVIAKFPRKLSPDELRRLRSAANTVGEKWNLPDPLRGEVAHILADENLPRNFETIDRVVVDDDLKPTEITSIKSHKLYSTSFQQPGTFLKTLKGEVDVLADFKEARVGEIRVTAETDTARVLEVEVQPDTLSPETPGRPQGDPKLRAQWRSEAADAAAYARGRGVSLRFKEAVK